MRFTIEQRFPATPDAVEAVYLDPAFVAARAELSSVGLSELLSQDHDGQVVRQRVRCSFGGELSAAVRRVIDPGRLTWVEEWELDRSSHRCRIRIVPDHYGDRLRCSMASVFEVSGGGTRRTTEGEIDVPMPLVGRRVEAAIVSGLRDNARQEETLVGRWLGG